MRIINFCIVYICCSLSFTALGKDIAITNTLFDTTVYNGLTDTTYKNSVAINLSFSLQNNTNTIQEIYVSIINPTIDSIFIKDNDKKILLGDAISFKKRTTKHSNHIYVCSLPIGSQHEISITIKKNTKQMNCRVKVDTQNSFIKNSNHDNFFLGIFYGVFFMYILLLICFYIFTKSNFFINYIIINVFMLLLLFQYSGNGYQYVWFYSAFIQKYITFFAVTGYVSAHIMFINNFFALRYNSPISGILLKVISIAFGLLAIAYLVLLITNNRFASSTNLIYSLPIIVFLIYGITVIGIAYLNYKKNKQREVIWVIIGMLLHIINWMIFINNAFAIIKPLNSLANFRWFDSNIFVPHLNYTITLLEMFIITIFISINYHRIIRQNILSLQRLEFLQNRNINTFIIGQEDEREKISNTIETNISSDIYALQRKVKNIVIKEDTKNILHTVQKDIVATLDDIKNITNNYVAPDLQKIDIKTIIASATDKLHTELTVNYNFTKMNEHLFLNATANIHIYRILQEISNNILKHANAQNVYITGIQDNASIQIKIEDDGVGFKDAVINSKGIGLMNIESRVTSLNGHFNVRSNENKGTAISIIFNIKQLV